MALRPLERSADVFTVLAALSDESSYEQLSELVGPGYTVVRCEQQATTQTSELTLEQFVEQVVEQCSDQVAAVFVEASLGGAQILAALCERQPTVRRVLITRGDDPAGLEEALERAEIDYVVRPPLARLHVAKAVHMLLESFDRARASSSILRSLRKVSATRGEPAALAELYQASDLLDSVHSRESSPASNLYGTHAFMRRLREEVARARRYKKNLTLLHLDVDEFGTFNQAHGWEGGNEALARVIHEISPPRGGDETDDVQELGCVRACDIVGRLGGQSFAVLLPETSRKGGQTIAERIRDTVGNMRFGDTSLTVSIGVSSFPADAIGPVELFDGAVAAQQLAKNGGKNRSCLMPGVTDTEFAHEREQFSYYHGHLDEITANLERDRSVSCLFVDLSHLRRIEREYGVTTHAEFFARAGELLADTRGSCLRREDQLYRTQDADGYLAFLAPPRATDGAVAPLDLDSIASRVEQYLADALSEDVGRLTSERVRVVVGYARVLTNPMARGERTILKVIADAANRRV